MQKHYLKYNAFIRSSILVLLWILINASWMSVSAEPDYEVVRDLLLAGDVEGSLTLLEKEPILDKNEKIRLGTKDSEYYGITLIMLGEINKAQSFLEKALEKYPKNQEIKNIRKHIDFYNKFYINKKLNFTQEELNHIEINDLLYSYFGKSDLESPAARELKKKIIKNIEKLDKAIPYFPTALDYLLEFKDPALDPEIEKLALKTIEKKRKQLFPQTMDFYELASAYKSLAIISIKNNDLLKAKDYIKLAQFNIYKMKSIWLEEDLKIYRPILKITQRYTSFGYVLPQWLIQLREEYDAYLI